MIATLLVLLTFIHGVRTSMKEPRFRAIAGTLVSFLAIGTIFYHYAEGWRWLDSIYFCVITLATVGYGDFSPQTNLGKIFTMLYVVLGVGAVVAFASAVFDAAVDQRAAGTRRLQQGVDTVRGGQEDRS